jgi:hypothetical protein
MEPKARDNDRFASFFRVRDRSLSSTVARWRLPPIPSSQSQPQLTPSGTAYQERSLVADSSVQQRILIDRLTGSHQQGWLGNGNDSPGITTVYKKQFIIYF